MRKLKLLQRSTSFCGGRTHSFDSTSSSESTKTSNERRNQNTTCPMSEKSLHCSASSSTSKRTGSRRPVSAAARSNLLVTTPSLANVVAERKEPKTAQQEQESPETVAQRSAGEKEKFKRVSLENSPPIQVQLRKKPQDDCLTRLSLTSRQASSNSLNQLLRSSSRRSSKRFPYASSGGNQAFNDSRFLSAASTLDLMEEYERILDLDEDDDKNDVVAQDDDEGSLDLEMSAPELSSFCDSSSLHASSSVVVGDDFFSRYEEIIAEHDEHYNYYNEATKECSDFGFDSLSSLSTSSGGMDVYRLSQGASINHDSWSSCGTGDGCCVSLRGFKHNSCSSFGASHRGSLEGGSSCGDASLIRIPERAARRSRRSSIN